MAYHENDPIEGHQYKLMSKAYDAMLKLDDYELVVMVQSMKEVQTR